MSKLINRIFEILAVVLILIAIILNGMSNGAF